MPHIMFVGPVGSGKTYMATREALLDAGDFIVTNTPFDREATDQYFDQIGKKDHERIFMRADGSVSSPFGIGGKQLLNWSDFAEDACFLAKCGTLLIDEAPLWLDARKYDSLSAEARMKIIEHRKDDLTLVSTAQDVSFIDKVFRTLCDEIRMVRMVRLPFIGWIWPTSVRPTIVCRDCGRVRRDGKGDDRGIFKMFGFGTAYSWQAFKAKDLLDAMDVTGESVPEPKRLGSGMSLFDIRIAACYSTSLKLSDKAKEAMAGRLRRNYGEKRGATMPQEKNQVPTTLGF